MNPFNKLLVIVATVLAVGAGVAIAAGTNGGSSSNPATTVSDVKGPCDEAEHASDPECAGAQIPEDDQADDQGNDGNDDRGRGRDHPEDDGVVGDDVNDDNAGQGEVEDNDDQGEVEDRNDDNSGPSANSGPGSGHDGDDTSGPSGHSGSGGGDDDGGDH